MRRKQVDSSVVASIGYDEQRALLEIEFLTGKVYAYRDVPPAAHDALLAAESIGRHFNLEIRDRYACTLVSGGSRFPRAS
ncbi:MAG TPA: KTSC domain-containing protein [Thermoanaerobaculia bacterium]|nr:KTSC domain-containing protein [Thermoanaerobaculia bacterium]